MNPDSSRCFRAARYFLHIGVACTVFFGLSSFGWPILALSNSDGSFRHPREAALFFGAFWACWTLLGVWLMLTFVWSRLYISPKGIRRVGCLRVRTMDFDELLRACWRVPSGNGVRLFGWRIPQGGSLVLHGRDSRLTVHFSNLRAEDWREVIELLHRAIDECIQEDWAPFESRVLAPRIKALEAGHTEP